jgi:hypothetical protein
VLLDREGLQRLRDRIAEPIARALRKADGGRPGEGLVLLRETCAAVLGVEFGVLSMLDVNSTVDLLAGTERVVAFAQLVEAMAQLETGDVARRRYEHALQLAAAQRERKKKAIPELDALVERVLARLR